MRSFSPGLFDRLAEDEPSPSTSPHRQRARSQALDACKLSITRDLVALLNTRAALRPDALQAYPAVAGSVVVMIAAGALFFDDQGRVLSNATPRNEAC